MMGAQTDERHGRSVPHALTTSIALRAEGLSKTYANGFHALRDVNFAFAEGVRLACLGPSGCGKTTLLRLLAGLEMPSKGQVTIFGKAPQQSHGQIGFVFQNPELLPWKKVLDNILLPLKHKKAGKAAALAALEQVGLAHCAQNYPFELSRGMQMRVSLARAIITQPKLLLLDEPFASLDEMIKAQLQKLLLDLNETHGMTMVMITHAVWDAALFATDAILMRPREVVEILPLSGNTGEDARKLWDTLLQVNA